MIENRSATADDIPFITEVYNDAILNTTATFDTEVKSIEDRMLWFKNHDSSHPNRRARSRPGRENPAGRNRRPYRHRR